MSELSFQKSCTAYLSSLGQQLSNPQATGELSLRAALDALLQNAKLLTQSDVMFVGEGKKIAQGRPDFVVTNNGVPVAYIEAEKFGSDLDQLSGHAKHQNDGFIQNLDSFLLTNHLDFRLFQNGKIVAEVSLPAPPQGGSTPVVAEDKAEKLLAILEQLMQSAPPKISDPRELAFHLSRRARQMNSAVLETLEIEDAEIQGDYQAFQQVLLPHLTREEFADLYAQTFAYGLFAARCNFNSPSDKFTRGVAAQFLAGNPFLKKLFTRFAGELDAGLVWIADDMAALLANADIQNIREYFAAKTGHADPLIDFYEPFLKSYDARLRDLRGVYYTPQPVVQYIVNSTHALLKSHFGKAKGLADEQTLLLDPATGTGSFLFAAIDRIHDEVGSTLGSGAWGGYVEKHLLHRVFGFELMVAPYSIAHLKLGLQLAGQGAPIVEGERFGIYLTNTLDDAVKQSDLLLGKFVSDEANEAVRIKNEEPILVVLGNPPYSGHSANAGKDARGKLNKIGRLIDAYKFVDGAPLGEKNPKWLQDDYVKFIAFAQDRIEKTGEGVVAFITNHGYLDNPTFRGMRQSLLRTFDEIYVLDLHGNAKKKERAPDGGKDENVFEIMQGVAILFAVKRCDSANEFAAGKPSAECRPAPTSVVSAQADTRRLRLPAANSFAETQNAQVFHADLWGKREDKYAVLAGSDISVTPWQKVQPSSPSYFFIPQDTELLEEYSQGWKVTDIFPVNVLGFQTHRDAIAVAFDEEKLLQQVTEYLGKKPSPSDWEKFCSPCDYRPFDKRFVYLGKDVTDRPRQEILTSVLGKENLCFGVGRAGNAVEDPQWSLVLASDLPFDANVFRRGGINVAPLYLYPDQSTLGFDDEHRPNINPTFLKAFTESIGITDLEDETGWPKGITPEMIFHYMYAILHSPNYRARYAAFLKTDFPRVPLPDFNSFQNLRVLGEQLVALHLMDVAAAPILNEARHKFEGVGNRVVEKVEYSQSTRRVKINADQWFENVPESVWEFRVGGYQVADKWLKDRKSRVLSFDEISHYGKVLIALAKTEKLMTEIDETLEEWPLW